MRLMFLTDTRRAIRALALHGSSGTSSAKGKRDKFYELEAGNYRSFNLYGYS